ncbi:aminotransferase class IV [Flavihumibacter petaseus]|uniref:branched-chain-amino-acid transaminase n=1 Tax=Flavihumibacter petaseus NBRC 106054 TaxID=1220578 RepID=A0A0E9N3Y5_9BACT|nr:aminotransferase class IV [Flavihumibacter petaseus]GAO44498.1 putative aminotransferase [Flavihumibacter petaseus NBRC 106054]
MTVTNFSWINGTWFPANDASIGISDLALQRGFGIFDFFRIIDGKPVFLEDHLDRFFRSSRSLGLDPGWERQQLVDIIHHIATRNNLTEGGIKLLLTGGYSADGYTPGKPNLMVTASPMLFERGLGAGLHLMSVEHQRQLPEIKTIDYLMAVHLQPQLKASGADDMLYYSQKGVTECPRANFFMVTADGVVLTPATGILKGVTRKKVLESALPGIPVIEKDFSLVEAMAAAEAFITSTTKPVRPVVAIDGKVIGNGSAGAITRQLNEWLQAKVFTGILYEQD